jgi:acetyl esterase/lipase
MNRKWNWITGSSSRLLWSGVILSLAVVALGRVNGAPAADLVRQPDLVYSTSDGEQLKLDLVRPQGDGPFPLLVCIHGGGWRQGSRQEYKDLQTTMAGFGYATASVQYRFAPKHSFPAPLDDVQQAIRFLLKHRAEYRIDPDRVGFLGGSAGGHLSLLAGFTAPADWKVRAIVNVAGPTDLRTFRALKSGDTVLKGGVGRDSSELVADLLGTDDRAAAVYRDASPVAFVTASSPPVITLHGDADDIVPIDQAETLHTALKEAGVTENLVRIPKGGHDLGRWPETEKHLALVQAVMFLHQHLRDVKP